jgi:hypothetical protein
LPVIDQFRTITKAERQGNGPFVVDEFLQLPKASYQNEGFAVTIKSELDGFFHAQGPSLWDTSKSDDRVKGSDDRIRA